MSRLDCLDDALIALAVVLHDHGPACVCVPCTAYAQATALLPRLGHVLAILEGWSRGEPAEETFWLTTEDIGMLLTLLEEG